MHLVQAAQSTPLPVVTARFRRLDLLPALKAAVAVRHRQPGTGARVLPVAVGMVGRLVPARAASVTLAAPQAEPGSRMAASVLAGVAAVQKLVALLVPLLPAG